MIVKEHMENTMAVVDFGPTGRVMTVFHFRVVPTSGFRRLTRKYCKEVL